MEAFEPSSDAGKRECKSSSKVQGLESQMNEFESNSDSLNREWKFGSWNRECRSSNQVRCLESKMEEFEPDSDSWNREWRSSNPVRGLESKIE